MLVDEGALPSSPGEFHGLLRASIDAWRAQGKRGVWLRVPTSKAALAGPAAELGFEFHSASPGWVLMTRWLPSGPNTLPAGASHQVGVGAIVVNSKGELLVVQERNGPLKGTGVWKMPTGLSDYGEDVMDTAVREVHEEAGEGTGRVAVCMRRRVLHGGAGEGTGSVAYVHRVAGHDMEARSHTSSPSPRPCRDRLRGGGHHRHSADARPRQRQQRPVRRGGVPPGG